MSDLVLPAPPERRPIASVRHTLVLGLIFALVALAGAASARSVTHASAGGSQSLAMMYLSTMAAEWGLVYFVWRGTRRLDAHPVRTLVGGWWRGVGAAARDVVLAAALWGTWMAIEYGMGVLLPRGSGPTGLLPHGAAAGSLWVLLSASAGFAEELVFRGYLMRQLAALTGRPWVALVLQALLFGVAHGYQGVAACLKIAMFGLLFGAVALWRRDLRACIIAHAWTDIAAGLIAF